MKIIILFLALISFLQSEEGFNKPLESFETAIDTFEAAVERYESNVYFYEDKEKIYHVVYDPSSSTETDYSFLQIYTSGLFEDTLTHYRQIENKNNLYIKKFNKLYFLRLRNKYPEHTQKMYIQLKEKYPDIYHSRAVKKVDKQEVKKKEHKITFIESRQEKIKTNILKDLVFSISKDDDFPPLKAEKIIREGSLEKIDDMKNSSANFAIIRGDVLGIKNAGLYGLEPFSNYGILCSRSEEMLYLVSKEEIKSIYDLRGKSISVGNISDIAQIYLQEIAKDSGVILDINFRSFPFASSVNKVKEGRLDAFFIFAPKDKISDILDAGLYISSMPDDFTKKLSQKQGLTRFKYKIDDRVIQSYKVPDFIVASVETLDTGLSKKIDDVVGAFGCYANVKIPDVFYGNIHPLLQASLAAQQLKAEKDGAISMAFYKEAKGSNEKTYYYQITNVSAEDVNLSFEQVKTNAFDRYAFKPRHILKLELANPVITVKANSKKLISFKYSNPFATRLKDIKMDLHFQESRMDGKHFSIPLTVGDN